MIRGKCFAFTQLGKNNAIFPIRRKALRTLRSPARILRHSRFRKKCFGLRVASQHHRAILDTLKPNSMEVEILTGIHVENEETASLAARALWERGVKNLFISMGADGIYCFREAEGCLIPVQNTRIVSVNGAGDTTMAAIAWIRFKYGSGISLETIGRITQAAAGITLESEESVSPKLSEQEILLRMEGEL